MVLSSNMPSEIMDQRNTPSFYKSAMASSFYSEKIHIPSDKNLGLWETASMPDHSGLDAFPFMGGGKSVSSSALENSEHKFVDHIENSQKNAKEPQKFINFDHPQMGAASTADSWRIPNLGVTSMSKLYNQPTVSQKTGMNGGYYENGLFSSSMSDMFNRRRLISNDVAIGQPANTTITNLGDVEAFESSEEVEAQTIGDLLPDDDDLFSGAIHNQGNVPQYNWTDVDDDLFCSVGGLELESDHNINSRTKMASETDYSKEVNNKNRGSNMPQPSRTLLVKNIDNIEDTELRALFELYGDLQTFYSLSRNHGFIMVSYYDIRAAQNAEVMLQGGTINGQTLDIQFYVKDVFSESKTSDGVLLVTNINTSVSNDDLLHIFGRIGEIKEIREISQNWDCRIIEFYDVRAADAAISALNGCDIAGKRIKVEPWCLRDSRFSSIQKSTLDIEGGDSSRFRQEIYPKKALLECFGTSSNHRSGSVPGSVDRRTFGIPYSIPRHISSQSTISVIGNNDLISANSELSHSLGKMNLGSQNMASFPDFRDGIHSGMQFNSPNTMSAMAMNINSTLVSNGIDSRSMHRVGSIGNTSHSFELNKSGFSSGNSDYVWNDSNAYRHLHPGSMSWQNLAPYMNNNIIQAQTPQVLGLSRGPSHMPNHILAPNHHVGSAPSIAFHPNSLGSMGYSSCSPLHSYDFSSQNIFPAATGTNLESSISSTHVGTPSSQPRAHTYRAKSNTSTRSRRSHSSANQSDSSRQFDLDLDRISRGEDLRTTLMIKNIPNKYTSKMLLATIDEQHKGTYDFIYLPIDFKNKCNVGYAFINMTDPQHIIPFYKAFNGKKWEKFNSEKVAYLAYARIQGKAALIGHFQNSSLMSEDKRCRPILFHTDGPNAGDQEPFPVPAGANIRYRRSRTNAENNQSSTSGSSSEEDESSTSPKDFE